MQIDDSVELETYDDLLLSVNDDVDLVVLARVRSMLLPLPFPVRSWRDEILPLDSLRVRVQPLGRFRL